MEWRWTDCTDPTVFPRVFAGESPYVALEQNGLGDQKRIEHLGEVAGLQDRSATGVAGRDRMRSVSSDSTTKRE
jgi:hypothetical protein